MVIGQLFRFKNACTIIKNVNVKKLTDQLLVTFIELPRF